VGEPGPPEITEEEAARNLRTFVRLVQEMPGGTLRSIVDALLAESDDAPPPSEPSNRLLPSEARSMIAVVRALDRLTETQRLALAAGASLREQTEERDLVGELIELLRR
jgi:hypothetical protein